MRASRAKPERPCPAISYSGFPGRWKTRKPQTRWSPPATAVASLVTLEDVPLCPSPGRHVWIEKAGRTAPNARLLCQSSAESQGWQLVANLKGTCLPGGLRHEY